MSDPAQVVFHLIEGQCSGECCRLMTLSATPEQVAVLAAGQRHAERLWESHKLNGGTAADWVEPKVDRSPAAVYVETHWVPVRQSFYDGVEGTRFTGQRGPKPQQQYRCKQWDGNTRMCLDYENRPRLCRAHGITYQCKRADCSCSPIRSRLRICVGRTRAGRSIRWRPCKKRLREPRGHDECDLEVP